jgi:CBS domain-containing protein
MTKKRQHSEVQDWMTENPATISPQATLAAAYDLMLEREVRRLPVVDHDLVGIITLGDILREAPVAGEDTSGDNADMQTRLLLTEKCVRDVATYDPVTINPSATIQEAAERMLEYQVSGLPVIRNGKLVGIITESDIFRLVVESWAEEG